RRAYWPCALLLPRRRGSSARPEAALEFDERKRSTGGIAALVLLFHAGAGESLRLVFHRDDAIADRQAARRQMRDDLEVDGLAADHAAQRNGAVIRPPLAPCGIGSNRYRRRNFKRAG